MAPFRIWFGCAVLADVGTGDGAGNRARRFLCHAAWPVRGPTARDRFAAFGPWGHRALQHAERARPRGQVATSRNAWPGLAGDGVGWKLRRVKERLAATDGGLVLRKDLGAALIDAGLATKVPTVVGTAANRDVKAGGIAAACVDTLLAAGAQIGVRRCQSRRTSRRDGRWGFGWRGFRGPVAASKYRQGNPE